MKNLNQGQEISKFRGGLFDDSSLKVLVIFTLSIFSGMIIGSFFWLISLFLLKEYQILLSDDERDYFFIFYFSMIFVGTLAYYYSRPFKDKNPSVSFFANYLLVRNEKGEVEVPFKMIKRFRLLENERKVVVEYKEEYMFCIKLDNGNYIYKICENPRLAKDLILPGPDSIHFPQDTLKELYYQGEFSFWLISNSRKINLSIVDELNEKLN